MSGSVPDNPFVEMENFAKRFVLSCRTMLVKHLILKGTEHMEDMEWKYLGGGVVEYTYTSVERHPPGFHMVGSNGFCDFAAFSEWEERVVKHSKWNVVTNTNLSDAEEKAKTQDYYRDMIAFMDLVFETVPVSYKRVMGVIMPAFDRIKKFW